MTAAMPAKEREWWEVNGYLAGRPIGNDTWICVAPMLYTFRLMLCTPDYVMDFYCYPDRVRALSAFELWDGEGDPPDGWVKHHATGRRREVRS